MNEYQSAITSLFARTGTTAKLGLERTSALLSQSGDPHLAFPSFHVAGTNGKGSVVAMLYALLRSKGLSVGRYTSPHLVDFRERIVVDDEEIGEDEVLSFLRHWEPEAERLGATFFEITTVMAFDHFARRGVDVAVIETGMGGRLDATNVIMPLAAGITTISMDHAEYLGDSIAQIAREKAGIFKCGVPAVIGNLANEAEAEVRACAVETGAPLVAASSLYPVRSVKITAEGTDVEFGGGDGAHRARLGLIGSAQAENASVALAMLHAAGGEYRTGLEEAEPVLATVRLHGRFERIGKFVLDVAHNPAGVAVLSEALESVGLPRPIIAVVGILRDKDWPQMLLTVAGAADRVIVTQPTMAPGERLWDLDDVLRVAGEHGLAVEAIPRLRDALASGDDRAATVLVTGSFYTVGEALQELGMGASRPD